MIGISSGADVKRSTALAMNQLTVLVTLLTLTVSSVSSMRTHFVYWNSTNPAFSLDNTEQIIDINENNLAWDYDQLHLVCPQNTDERHVVYSVSREEYDSCRVTNPKPKIVAICNKPESFMYFTITFRSFSPTPGGLEFKPGQTYYLISTSTQRDIHRRAGGFCSSHNMKMVFNVADREAHPAVNSPLLSAVTSSTRRPRPPATPSSVPVYYYKSRAPSVHTSDYIYYYSPRDLVQLKLAARKHDRGQINTQKEQEAADRRAAPLTSSSSSSPSVTSLSLTLSLGFIFLLCLL